MRKIAIQRKYYLGQYATMDVSDEYYIPDHLDTNEDFIQTVRNYLMIGVEKTYLQYLNTQDLINKLSDEDRLEQVKIAYAQISEELLGKLKGE
jgi:hypothetical protein